MFFRRIHWSNWQGSQMESNLGRYMPGVLVLASHSFSNTTRIFQSPQGSPGKVFVPPWFFFWQMVNFIPSDIPLTWHHLVPIKLPNLINTYTRLDNRDFVTAFKDVVCHLSQPNELIRLCQKLSSAGKVFINHCYAWSCDLLVDIPLENYRGIVHNSLHAVPPNCQAYINESIEWDPCWGYNIFHTFVQSGQNSMVVRDRKSVV